MNTLEKRKLEALVVGKIQTARELYQNARQIEYKAMVNELASHPPAKVGEILKKLTKLHNDHVSQFVALEEGAKSLGYQLDITVQKEIDPDVRLISFGRFVEGEYKQLYTEPTLLAHDADTNKTLVAFDEIKSKFAVEIWSDGAEMKTVFDKFQKELAKIAV